MRIFLAIPFAIGDFGEAKNFWQTFLSLKKKLRSLNNIRWENEIKWHMTLVFFGDIEDIELKKIIRVLENAFKNVSKFEIKFKEIKWHPSNKYARMIWLKGQFSEKANNLKKEILEQLNKKDFEFKVDKRPLLSHITIARIKPPLNPAPKICQKIDFSLNINTIELWQSFLSRGGSTYKDIKKFNLN